MEDLVGAQKTIVLWIHGIQLGEFDPEDVNECIKSLDELLPPNQFIHQISDWGRIIADRQRQVYNIVSYRGNWLTRKIRESISSLGLDMWMWLQTKAGNMDGDWALEVRRLLDKEIDDLDAKYGTLEKKPKLVIIGHSWGTIISLDYFIRHPWRSGKLITMGSPAPIYGSSCFKNWGDPTLLSNIEKWVNIGIPNDPISNLMKDNPNPSWNGVVDDLDIPSWIPFPIKAHCSYWSNKKAIAKIAETLLS